MRDSGVYFILTRLLRFKTQEEAKEYAREHIGTEYLDLFLKLIARLKFGRTLSQNALLHMWFGEIAKWHGDRTLYDVKGQCHHRWALDVRLQDEKFAWIWERTGAGLSYEKQCSLLAAEVLSVSSGMTTKELSEYMNEIEQHYRPLGVPLTIPEERGAKG